MSGLVHCDVKKCCHLLAVLVMHSGISAWCAAPLSEVKQVRQKACVPYQASFDTAAIRWRADLRFKEYQDRVAQLEGVAGQVLKEIGIHQAAYLKRNLATFKEEDTATAKPVGALKLLMDNQASFSKPLPLPQPNVPAGDQKLLQTYYEVFAKGLTEAVWTRAKDCLRGQDAAEVQKLALVLPLLHSTDETWSDAEIERLPAWLKRAEAFNALEELAVFAHRPRSAYAFMRGAKAPDSVSAEPGEFIDFLENSADTLLRAKNYETAMDYLKLASDRARTGGLPERRTTLQFHIIEVLNDTGAAKQAVEELGRLMQEDSRDSTHGKATLLRLKYLYGAGESKQVLTEFAACRNDKRCEPFLPQILYVGWIANRHLGDMAAAEALQNEFIAKYPEDPLGADIFFASAMKALAALHYDDTTRILQFIQYRYPTAKISGRAKDIEQQLAKNLRDGATNHR